MRVRIVRRCYLQDAGVERPLSVGQTYDLPDQVAQRLIDKGTAIEDRVLAVPETKRRGMR